MKYSISNQEKNTSTIHLDCTKYLLDASLFHYLVAEQWMLVELYCALAGLCATSAEMHVFYHHLINWYSKCGVELNDSFCSFKRCSRSFVNITQKMDIVSHTVPDNFPAFQVHFWKPSLNTQVSKLHHF